MEIDTTSPGTDGHINLLQTEKAVESFLTKFTREGTKDPLYPVLIHEIIENGTNYLHVNSQHLKTFDLKLYQDLIHSPNEILPSLDGVANKIKNSIRAQLERTGAETEQIQVRPFNLSESKALRGLNPKDLETLISIKGLVINVDKHQVIQETPDVIPQGETPQTVKVNIPTDLLHITKPGDRVEITGVYKPAPIRTNPSQPSIKSSFDPYVECIHLKKLSQTFEESKRDKERKLTDDSKGFEFPLFSTPLDKNEFVRTEDVAATPSTHLILNEAKYLGINSRKISGLFPAYVLYQYKNHQEVLKVNGGACGQTVFESDFCKYKTITMLVLPLFNLSVPKTLSLAMIASKSRKNDIMNQGIHNADVSGKTVDEIIEKSIPIIKEKLQFPLQSIVVKPVSEGGGVGVTVGIGGNPSNSLDHDTKKLKDAITKAFKVCENDQIVLVQSQTYGNEFRVYLLQGKIIAIFEKVNLYVYGDGKQNIQNLINIENKKSWRIETGFLVKHSPELVQALKDQGLTLDSVLAVGAKASLHTLGNIGQGAISIDRTDDVHPSFAAALSVLYSKGKFVQLGIDIICEDISKDINSQKYSIIEVNDRPGFRSHHAPSYGKKRNVARAILGAVFPELIDNPLFLANGGPAPAPWT